MKPSGLPAMAGRRQVWALALLLGVTFGAAATTAVSAEDIVIDNEDGPPSYTESGTWSRGDSPGHKGITYRWTHNDGVLRTATWTPEITTAGQYLVYAAFRASFNRTRDAHYTINHAQGSTVVRINQHATPAEFRVVLLGQFQFDKGTSGTVQLANTGQSGAVSIADAILFRPAGNAEAEKVPAQLYLQMEEFAGRR